MKVKDWDINIIQQLAMILDRVTTREKHDDFLFEVLF